MCYNAEYFHGHIDKHLESFGLTTNAEGKPLCSKDIVDIIEGYEGQGHGFTTDEELGKVLEVHVPPPPPAHDTGSTWR